MRNSINQTLLLLLLLVPFVPYFGSIDKIGSQWFFLSIVNLIIVVYNFFYFDYISTIRNLLSKYHFIFYLSFLCFVLLSFLTSNNISLSVVDGSRIIITFLSIINFYIFLKKYNVKLIALSKLISVILFIELFFSLRVLLDFIIFNDIQLLDYNKLTPTLLGISGNRNVLAFDLVFKLIFVFYAYIKTKSIDKYLYLILFFLTAVLLFLLSSRGALIIFIFVSMLFLFYTLRSKLYLKLFFLFPLLCALVSVSYLNANRYNIAAKVSSVGLSDESTTHRIFLYENALDYISHNPFIGCGIGNWKVESLPYWKDRLSGYTIPYHAHNDFLELSTEIGLLGGISYLFIFISILFTFFILYIKSNKLEHLTIFSLCAVYFFDASINFPLERALSQVNFILLVSLSLFLTKIKLYEKGI